MASIVAPAIPAPRATRDRHTAFCRAARRCSVTLRRAVSGIRHRPLLSMLPFSGDAGNRPDCGDLAIVLGSVKADTGVILHALTDPVRDGRALRRSGRRKAFGEVEPRKSTRAGNECPARRRWQTSPAVFRRGAHVGTDGDAWSPAHAVGDRHLSDIRLIAFGRRYACARL